ncbi:N-acetylmuramoyl-L-alanine amidase [Paucisalibacillus sp. EB02]|uniref:N-acetylmuramoyl-L-alanine amidase n=1 Tax=Paucisalibacillus sp. EB02 TaxID=1347087 RepID=UPI0004B69C84|nr:N-acetylmuramoyl-L-alanine amidase [Paucisalibacillus sp. EB02]
MRKRNIVVILICLVLVSWNFPVTASTKEVIINEDNLNLRSGPGTTYGNLGQVHKDEVYTVIKEQAGWVEILLDGYTAWVSTDYVSIQGEFTDPFTSGATGIEDTANSEDIADSTDTEEHAVQKSINVVYNQTQVRNGPSTEYEIIYLASKGEKLQVIEESDSWLKVKLEDSEGYVFKELIEKTTGKLTEGLSGKTIVIDPGHGGDDSGALSVNEVYERDLTYKTADILAQELSILGAEVIMTRDEETFVSLASRATLANTVNADAFISLHYNSVPNLPNVTGISTYYYQEQFEPLANYIQQEIIKESEDRDRGVDFGDFQVIRQNLMPSVLIELGFISNPEIEQLLLTNVYQEKLVTGIVNGLQRYFAIQ